MPLTLNSRRYFVAAFGFFIKFWVDKWAVLNVYMKPPLYGIELFEHFEEARFRLTPQLSPYLLRARRLKLWVREGGCLV